MQSNERTLSQKHVTSPQMETHKISNMMRLHFIISKHHYILTEVSHSTIVNHAVTHSYQHTHAVAYLLMKIQAVCMQLLYHKYPRSHHTQCPMHYCCKFPLDLQNGLYYLKV